ncbi:hypothetical protein [Pseudomonas sp. 2FE]|uniref:hypothetical protein n=1 Tax=Pseudomonas sp. 2FE TaxID=2502190 RepID=UPI003556B190
MPSHQLDYEILGTSAQTVEVILEAGLMDAMAAGFRFAPLLAEWLSATTFNPHEDARGRGDN